MNAGLRTLAIAAGSCVMTAGVAYAHTGVGITNGFMPGFLHPITGLDHVLAMVTVGLLAAQLGGLARWLVPLSFVFPMALGGVLGVTGIAVPFVEFGIGLSVLVLGSVIALQLRPTVPVAMTLTAFFAIFHGHAHGTEMPETAAAFSYGIGFAVASASLLATGIGLHRVIETAFIKARLMLVRSVGTGVAAIGLAAIVGIL